MFKFQSSEDNHAMSYIQYHQFSCASIYTSHSASAGPVHPSEVAIVICSLSKFHLRTCRCCRLHTPPLGTGVLPPPYVTTGVGAATTQAGGASYDRGRFHPTALSGPTGPTRVQGLGFKLTLTSSTRPYRFEKPVIVFLNLVLEASFREEDQGQTSDVSATSIWSLH